MRVSSEPWQEVVQELESRLTGTIAGADAGPDDPSSIWSGSSMALESSVTSWRFTTEYETGLLNSQLAGSTDNGSRRTTYLEKLCTPIDQVLSRPRVRVLQPGCGVGNWIPFLAERCPTMHFVGFDRSRLIVEIARKNWSDRPRIELFWADILDGPELGPVDLLLLDYEILNHFSMSRAQSILEWACRQIGPDGCIFGDLRLASRKVSCSRLFSFSDRNRVIWYRRGQVSPSFHGRVFAGLEASTGAVSSRFQDLIRVYSVPEVRGLFDSLYSRGFRTTFRSLSNLPTDKAECRLAISFCITPE